MKSLQVLVYTVRILYRNNLNECIGTKDPSLK